MRTRRERSDRSDAFAVAIRASAWVGVVAVFSSYAMGEFGAGVWWMELFSHFRPHMLLGLAVCLLAFFFVRSRVGAIVTCCLLLMGCASVASWVVPRPAASASGSPLRLCVANVLTGNERFDETLDGIHALAPDLAVLIEVNKAMIERVRTDPRWRIEFEEVQRFSGWVVAIAPAEGGVRLDAARSVVLTPDTRNIPAIDMHLTHEGRSLRVLGVHARSPVSAGNAAQRNAQLGAIARWAVEATEPVVIAGDLNTTVWSHPYRGLERESGLRNAMRGRALRGTWPSVVPSPLRVGIDHVLYDDELVSLSRTLGDAGGSDHAPVLVELAWRTD
ncbi:MAG: endonuclease/exonuclease/phosphatase family protein [Planctomycetota bacterium]